MGDVPASPAWASLPPFPDHLTTAPLVTLHLSKLQEHDPAEQAALLKCAKELGFFYLNLTGCTEGKQLFSDAQQLLDLEKRFFAMPDEEKAICDRDTVEGGSGYYGWKKIGSAVMDSKGTPERHENYTIKKDDIVGNCTPLAAPQLIKDNFPLLRSFVLNAQKQGILMLQLLNESLQLPPGSLENMHRLHALSGDHVRFIRAPARGEGNSDQTAAEHTDFGSLTILFNWLGGLQVQLPGSKEWVYVRPIPGCAIINLGDAMVKFSGGLLRSNMHRVLNPPGKQANETRYSLVYFSRPEDDVVMRRLEGGLVEQQPKSDVVEPEYTSKEWILRRGLGPKTSGFKPENWINSRGTEGARSTV
ncbi:1-aminocyclopropane-1-carboxylate oxidase [Dacryopinax primogenitus]|uniref:1-aminocyclopropane-1-carboxylate oxidase n=1 Tax=Dacryopinax primogenitus (strain DJM 731) TaxID=1858805 RepID=M5FVS2_DACPD|nr:1-aminocyclopropane-1-carboxylate oxidase [Dacryopinax primogenitus]EJT97461.1 1-aminocyclopropane-1-carboxylate oxidase [Dacryopinax primogenitus]